MARNGKDDADIDDKDGGDKKIAVAPFNRKFYGYSIPFWVNSILGKPLLLIGLMLAILGRGCDATGMRSVARTDAAYQQEMIKFKLEWDGKRATTNLKLAKKQREVSDITEKMFKPDVKDDDRKSYQKQLDDLNKEMKPWSEEITKSFADQTMERAEKEANAWKSLREASLKASNSNRMWSFWYELAFIFGTLVLVLGLLIVAFSGEGAERWIAYVMMAIITFSVYVGGAAWIESIVTSATSMTGSHPTILPDEEPIPIPPGGKKKKGFGP